MLTPCEKDQDLFSAKTFWASDSCNIANGVIESRVKLVFVPTDLGKPVAGQKE